jgi:hypothetical protein
MGIRRIHSIDYTRAGRICNNGRLAAGATGTIIAGGG